MFSITPIIEFISDSKHLSKQLDIVNYIHHMKLFRDNRGFMKLESSPETEIDEAVLLRSKFNIIKEPSKFLESKHKGIQSPCKCNPEEYKICLKRYETISGVDYPIGKKIMFCGETIKNCNKYLSR